MIRSLFPLVALTMLGACADNIADDFFCEAQLGSPCSTISQADGGGQAGIRAVTEQPTDTALSTLSQDPLGVGKGDGSGLGALPDGGYAYDSRRYRVPEVVSRLWIAPYEDENEILHESRYVHFVLADPTWASR